MIIPKFRCWTGERIAKVDKINFVGNWVCESPSVVVEGSCDLIPLDEVILMQSTGLKDKNGVEIYEWDVLYFEPYKTHINDRVVQNIDGAYHGRLIRSGYSKLLAECVYETKVIGNIYEQPELLS